MSTPQGSDTSPVFLYLLTGVLSKQGGNNRTKVSSKRKGKPWILSNQGLVFMSVWESGVYNGKFKGHIVQEGMILEVYDDGYHIPTVGFGHKVLPSDNLRMNDKISLEQAKTFAKNDLKSFIERVNAKINITLSQYEFDALVSIAFNAGAYGGFGELADFVNKGRYDLVPKFIESYKSSRVPQRRKSEAKLFGTGTYDASH